MGKLVDRASIIRSAFSDMDTAVIKATKHNTKTPKEKHMRRLLVFSHDEPHKIGEMIHLLTKRLEFPDWLVVLKTLIVFHRLMRDGSTQVINELRYKSSIFNLRRFADMSSPEAHHQSLFVRKYSQYLEEKVLVYKILGLEFEKEFQNTKNYSSEELFERIPRLQSQLNALLNCRSAKDHLNNSIIIFSFGLMLKDSFKLYKALNDAIINMLEHYFSMPKANAMKALEIYKLFSKETDGLIQFFDITRRFAKTDLPEIQHAPTSLIDALEGYIKDIEEGRNPNPIGGASKDKKGHMDKLHGDKSKMDKLIFDDDKGGFDFDEEFAEKQIAIHAKTAPPVQQSNSSSSFDPFGMEPSQATLPVTKSASQATFDPFGDPFGPSTNNFGSNNQTQMTNQPSFDPFGPSTPAPANTVAYDDKKKQVEMLFGGNQALSSNPMTPTPAPAPANTNTGFGNNPYGNNNGFGNQNQTPNYNMQPSFAPQQQNPNSYGNPSFNPNNQYVSTQNQPSFQPASNNSNPFL